MPTFEITGPDGKRYRVTGDTPEGAMQALKKYGQTAAEPPALPAASPSAEPANRDFISSMTQRLSPKTGGGESPSPIPEDLIAEGRDIMARGTAEPVKRLSALTEGSQAGLMGGFDDELAAGMLAPINAAIDWARGRGFDMGEAYSRVQKLLDEKKQERRADYPVESIAGEVAGGLALGGKAAQSGLTLIGRQIPYLSRAAPRVASILTAAIEGGGYGALYGAGEADPGERAEGAITGAAIGATTGAVIQGVGNAVATQAAKRGATSQASQASSKALKDAAGDMFDASEASGITIKPETVATLAKRMKFAGGKINEQLRPKTAGYMQEIDDLFSGPVSLEDFEEFRQVLGQEIKRASANDARTLGAIKRTLDNFTENVKPTDISGDVAGVKLLDKARETWARAKKTEIIENILDIADVKGTGTYTQSGVANAARREMEKLYSRITKGSVRGFTAEEVDLIRQIAKGESNSAVVNLVAKFAPRGPVSIALGQVVGSLFPGGNFVVPIAGAAAGAAKDRATVAAVESLRNAASSGIAPSVGGQITARTAPFIGGGVAASTEVPRLSEAARSRR